MINVNIQLSALTASGVLNTTKLCVAWWYLTDCRMLLRIKKAAACFLLSYFLLSNSSVTDATCPGKVTARNFR